MSERGDLMRKGVQILMNEYEIRRRAAVSEERRQEVLAELRGERKPQSARFGPVLGDLRHANAVNCHLRPQGLPEVPIPGDDHVALAIENDPKERRRREVVEEISKHNRPLAHDRAPLDLRVLISVATELLLDLEDGQVRDELREQIVTALGLLCRGNPVMAESAMQEAERSRADDGEGARVVQRLRDLVEQAQTGRHTRR
jgi:hypothetical protein